jgi:hypothetical protein
VGAKRVVVFHSGYGCETGCCGHVVAWVEGEVDPDYPDLSDGLRSKRFSFDHPPDGADPRAWAEQLVTKTFGAEHVADLDWAHCLIEED